MVGRIKIGMTAVIIVLCFLTARLFYIQVICHETFKETAEVQYRVAVEGLDTRGQIYDRNLKPLTGATYQYYYILKTEDLDKACESLLAQTDADNVTGYVSGMPPEQIKYQVFRTERYLEDVNDVLKEEYGAYVMRMKTRYSDEQTACHIVGYINKSEKCGVSGLELYCEEKLEAGGNRLFIMADAAGNLLPGIAPVVSGDDRKHIYDNSVVTTVDSELQQRCESLLEGSAACVVSDAYTGEILAAVSSPGFNPNRIEDYLGTDGDCLINKTVQGAYPPGSVFKLVVAAAALESGTCAATRTFECTGEAACGGVTVSCATAPPGGHGMIDMYEAMAKSCNCYFVQLGQLTGTEKIIAMARRMGLGEAALDSFPEENEGNVPDVNEEGGRDISNLSIGQGTLLTTPVQINHMTAVIASGGKDIEFTLLPAEKNVVSGTAVMNNAVCTESAARQIISPETALLLQDMMRGVTVTGTASGTSWAVPVWAKTGTAEASFRGQPAKNCWLTGFCRLPADEAEAVPEKCFAITVFIEDGISGSASALPVFKKIVDYLAASAE